MPDKPQEESFTVVDRRGRRDRPEAPDAPGSMASSRVGSERSSAPSAGPASSEIDLAVLFFMLANSALVHLGEAPDPVTGAAHRDLGQARLSIDLLGLLREKTRESRTPEESALLDELLYDLQLRFVEATEGKV